MNWKEPILELYNTSKTLIVSPKQFWESKVETISLKAVTQYFMLFMVLVGVSAFVGGWIAGSKYGTDYWFLLFKALRDVFQYVVSVYLGCWAIREILAIEADKKNVLKLVVLSSIPAFMTTIITNLFSGVYILELFSLYSFYLMYVGVPYFFEGAKKHHFRFAGVSILIMIVSFVASYYILWNLLKLFYTV
jgi:hypothetical protein